MALREANKFALITGGSGSITAKAGESLRLKDVINLTTPYTGWIQILVNNSLIHEFPNGLSDVGLFGSGRGDDLNDSIFQQAARRGYDLSVPVAEGDTLTIQPSAGTPTIIAVYDVYDAADQKSDAPNGRQADELITCLFGTNPDAVSAAGDITLSAKLNAAQTPDFPFVDGAPSGKVVDVLAIVAQPFKYTSSGGVDELHSTHVKFYRDSDLLLTEDADGISFDGSGNTATSSTMTFDAPRGALGFGAQLMRGEPLWLPQPLSFEAGRELKTVVAVAVNGTVSMPANSVIFGYLLHFKPAR